MFNFVVSLKTCLLISSHYFEVYVYFVVSLKTCILISSHTNKKHVLQYVEPTTGLITHVQFCPKSRHPIFDATRVSEKHAFNYVLDRTTSRAH
jgi:hypothetical protein